MNILVLNYEFPPLGGGGGVASYKLAKGFVKLGHEVDVVTTWFKGLKKDEVIDGIHVYRVRVLGRKELPTATLLSMLAYVPAAYRKARDLAKKRKYDLINTHFAIPTGPVGVWISRKFNIQNILSLHAGDICDPSKKNSPHRKWYLRMVVGWVLKNSSILVAQSTNTKENTIKYYSPPKEIHIIPLPYEPIAFKKASRKQLSLDVKKKYLISVGRLIPRKDYGTLIKALALMKNKKAELIIVGDGPEKENLLQISKELDIVDRVHLLGFLSEDKKFQYLSNSDMYVLSSIHEGFGIVLQEAMQVGLPVIATNNGGQIDLITENQNGFLVKIKDAKALAIKIDTLLNEEKLRSKMSNRNKIFIKKFRVESIARDYILLRAHNE